MWHSMQEVGGAIQRIDDPAPGRVLAIDRFGFLADPAIVGSRFHQRVANGGFGGDVGAALGATGIKVPAPKVYETLASNAADGVVMPMEARKGFKLTEVAQNVYHMPGGLYRGSFALIMSQEAFDALPADVQEALDSKVFGEAASRMAGQVWDAIDVAGREVTEAATDNAINEASAADQAAFNGIAEGIRAKVLAEIAAKGVDSAAAYEMVKAEMAKGGS